VHRDSNDAQIFYQAIWDKKPFLWWGSFLFVVVRTRQGRAFHGATIGQGPRIIVETVKRKMRRTGGRSLLHQPRCRILKFGFGCGGLLRKMFRDGMIDAAVGSDVSNHCVSSINNKGLMRTRSKLLKNHFCNCPQLVIWRVVFGDPCGPSQQLNASSSAWS
jgi:hypothetical protein